MHFTRNNLTYPTFTEEEHILSENQFNQTGPYRRETVQVKSSPRVLRMRDLTVGKGKMYKPVVKRALGFTVLKTFKINKIEVEPSLHQQVNFNYKIFRKDTDDRLRLFKPLSHKELEWIPVTDYRRLDIDSAASTKNFNKLDALTAKFFKEEKLLLSKTIQYNLIQRNKVQSNGQLGLFEDESQAASYTEMKLKGLYQQCKAYKKSLREAKKQGQKQLGGRLKIFQNICNCRSMIQTATRGKFKREDRL